MPGPIPPTSLGYVARFRNTSPENSRSGENATKRSRSAVRPVAASRSGTYRLRVSPTGSVVSKMTVVSGRSPGAIDRGRGVHEAVVGLVPVIEHDGHDQDDDVGLADRRGRVRRRPQPAGGMRLRDALGEARLLGDVGTTRVDRRDHRVVHVDRDDRPAVGGELGRQREAHLAGAHDGHRPGGAGLSGPGRHERRRVVVGTGTPAGTSTRRARSPRRSGGS